MMFAEMKNHDHDPIKATMIEECRKFYTYWY